MIEAPIIEAPGLTLPSLKFLEISLEFLEFSLNAPILEATKTVFSLENSAKFREISLKIP